MKKMRARRPSQAQDDRFQAKLAWPVRHSPWATAGISVDWWMVLVLFWGVFMQAEQVICLDEDLVNQEIASIMRSHGIEPYSHKAMQMRALMKNFTLPARAWPIDLHDVSSITDLYAYGFAYLQQGKWREAFGVWAVVALHYPTSDAEDQMVNAAMNFVVHGHEHLFPVLRVIRPTKPTDTSLLILPPLTPSTLLAAFLIG